jgi:hypothetical protein
VATAGFANPTQQSASWLQQSEPASKASAKKGSGKEARHFTGMSLCKVWKTNSSKEDNHPLKAVGSKP